jgi:hypothetical protein
MGTSRFAAMLTTTSALIALVSPGQDSAPPIRRGLSSPPLVSAAEAPAGTEALGVQR